MKIQMKYFALCHDLFGRREETMTASEGALLSDVLQLLEAEKPELAKFYGAMKMAVNWEYVPRETPLCDGDEVALIPPVAGG